MTELKNDSEAIAIVSIDSVDYTNFNKKLNEYVLPFTYCQATVKKVLKGNLNPNEKINYTRLGGIISYDQWKKSLNAKQLSRLQEDDEAPDYYVFTVLDDIRIEPNLTYLVYLIKDTINESDEYSIQGIQYGLRQALITKSKVGTEAILVKDNNANKWISLNALMR